MIRNATKEIINDLNKLGEEYVSDFKKKYDIKKIINSSSEYIYYYEINNKPIGYIHFTYIIDTIDIINIYVTPKYRRHKIATKLLEHIIDFFHKCNSITLEVNVNNEKAINLYKKNDFLVATTRKKYYGNEDAYLMIRRK